MKYKFIRQYQFHLGMSNRPSRTLWFSKYQPRSNSVQGPPDILPFMVFKAKFRAVRTVGKARKGSEKSGRRGCYQDWAWLNITFSITQIEKLTKILKLSFQSYSKWKLTAQSDFQITSKSLYISRSNALGATGLSTRLAIRRWVW